jgi:hypothetical protein
MSYLESFGIQANEKLWFACNGACMLPQVPIELHLLQEILKLNAYGIHNHK